MPAAAPSSPGSRRSTAATGQRSAVPSAKRTATQATLCAPFTWAATLSSTGWAPSGGGTAGVAPADFPVAGDPGVAAAWGQAPCCTATLSRLQPWWSGRCAIRHAPPTSATGALADPAGTGCGALPGCSTTGRVEVGASASAVRARAYGKRGVQRGALDRPGCLARAPILMHRPHVHRPARSRPGVWATPINHRSLGPRPVC